jgi:hypothetical protein
MIAQQPDTDLTRRERRMADAGGIQSYVWWLGLGLMALAIAMGVLQAPALQK